MVQGDISVDQLLGPIYDAASDSRRWTDALEKLRVQLDAAAVAWVDFDFYTKTGSIRHSVGLDSDYVRVYSDRYAALNAWRWPGEWRMTGRVITGEEIAPFNELAKTKFYSEWLLPQGLLHRLCAVVRKDHHQVLYLEAWRSSAQQRFADRQKHFLKSLVPHLQRATQRGAHLWRLAITQEILDSLAFPVMAVDKNARLLFANCSAEELLDMEEGLLLRPEGVRVSTVGTDKQLKQLIAQVATSSMGKGTSVGDALIIQRGGSLTPLWVVVLPLGRKLRRVIGQEDEITLLFVSTPESLETVPDTALKTLYSLTPAEQRLVRLILQGYRLDKAAEKLDITHNTARTHMKRIYFKTKTERQTDLVRLLLTGPFGQLNFRRLAVE